MKLSFECLTQWASEVLVYGDQLELVPHREEAAAAALAAGGGAGPARQGAAVKIRFGRHPCLIDAVRQDESSRHTNPLHCGQMCKTYHYYDFNEEKD